MSAHSKITRTAVAVFASLLMSTVTIGTAVGPAHAVANPSESMLHA